MADAVKQGVKIVKESHLPLFHFYKRDDGIIKVTTADSAWVTIKEAREFVKAIKELAEGIPHLFLFIPGRHYSLEKEARTYMASKEALQYTIALGIVVRTAIHRIIGNTFITIDRPQKPVRHFANENDAIAWLKEQRT